ncbi:MAG: elongation factor Ts [Oscillospiraceae bacterium]|nr:elongation factor Ts [Oscillospiraceae bacterium]MBQ9939378.1 elongation factor Ts [Oscillospiraceae bacterium]
MNFTAKDVQTLRERTGVGMMDCKKALTEANGDMDKAIEVLREKGLAKQAKKAGRIASEGIVYALVDEAAKAAVMIEVNAETDFVAKNEKFVNFAADCAKTVLANSPADVDALLECKIAGTDNTVADALRDMVLVIGENIKIRRFVKHDGIACDYIHGGGRIGVLAFFETDDAIAAKAEFKAMAKDIAMQVAASLPQYLDAASVPAEVIDKEKEILLAQAMNEGKPANIAEKMVAGRIKKFYQENCLVDQAFIKDPDMSVSKYVAETCKTLGGDVKLTGFVRYERGEGLEKREDDFASEVANMVK